MTSISESTRRQSQIAAALRDGLEQVDLSTEVTFQGYTRVVLPLDGYVFWLPTVSITVKGSLHVSQEILQREDETVGFASVLFTAEQPVTEFEGTPTTTLWIARWDGLRYAFSAQQGFYSPAALWHYFGHSLYPALASQLIDGPESINPANAIVSNSLPIWLSLNGYVAPYADWFSNVVTLYPSFLVPSNLIPPYGAVHIGPTDTSVIQTMPWLSRERSSFQLAADKVRITLYGLNSNQAIDFLNFVLQWSVNNPDTMGITNMPTVTDGKRVQEELEAMAMQKVIEFEVSYHQARVAEISRQLIEIVQTSFQFLQSAP